MAAEETSAPRKTIKVLETKILQQQKKIYRLKKGIEGHKTRIKDSRGQEIDLLGELEKIDQSLAEQKEKLLELNQELEYQENYINQIQDELVVVIKEKEENKKHVERRITAYYRLGSVGIVNVLFSTTTLPDMLNLKENFQHMLEYDQKVLGVYREKITKLSTTREKLQKEIKGLLAVIEKIESKEAQLALIRQNRMALLTKIRTEKNLYKQALVEMEEAADNLSGTLKNLKKKASEKKYEAVKRLRSSKKRRPGAFYKFAAYKGKLDPPVNGTVSTFFGRNTTGQFGITTYANGIDIKTKADSDIKAIFAGKIIYSGILRGYGNLMIISHGDQYYSLVSRAAEFYKKENDFVKKGEVVGKTGDLDGLLGEGLHFEIRHGTEPQNPLHWINNAKLKIKASPKVR